MSKNVAVFVDVANIFYAAKAAGVDIDYVTLLKSATAGRDFIRAYAYTGLDPENENQRQFQSFLARNGYKVISKDIRKYGDGKVKANLDIELVVDMMKTARNVDIAVIVSGDGDFAPAIRAVQEMGVRVEVISFRGNTSSDLIDAADQFTDITQLAKVERSTRSGRRVAASETDLSMTAVPDKETEGAPRRRGRTTRPAAEAAPEEAAEMPAAAAAATEPGPSGRGPGRRGAGGRAAPRRPAPVVAARSAAEAIAAAGVTAPLRVLPGERLSRVGGASTIAAESGAGGDLGMTGAVPAAAPPDEAPEVEPGGEVVGETPETPMLREEEGRRRRRRRGGRGRGRGRGREREPIGGGVLGGETGEGAFEGQMETEPAAPYAPFRPPQSTFGSIWDSQLGMNVPSRPPSADLQPTDEEEEIEEPEIPEYLLAERRRGAAQGTRGGRGQGARGGRGAYAAALDRERFGRTGGPSGGWSPDRGPRPGRRPGQFRGPARVSHARVASAEPWSEVPPDLEEQIRAQLAATRAPAPTPQRPEQGPEPTAPAPDSEAAAPSKPAAPPKRRVAATGLRATRTRSRAGEAPASAATTAPADAEIGRASPTSRRGRGTSAAAGSGDESGAPDAAAQGPRPARGRPRRAAATGAASGDAATEATAAESPKRRTRSGKATQS